MALHRPSFCLDDPADLTSGSSSPPEYVERQSFIVKSSTLQVDPDTVLVQSSEDHLELSKFINSKIEDLNRNSARRVTTADEVFKRALIRFQIDALKNSTLQGVFKIRYCDFIAMFEKILTKAIRSKGLTFPTTLGVNAFRGFLNEFAHQQGKRKAGCRSEILLRKRYLNHLFPAEAAPGASKTKPKFFGAPLKNVVNPETDVPNVLNNMLSFVETNALLQEGIYRKCGSVPAIKRTRNLIELTPEFVDFDDVSIHVVTNLVKTFFRELPHPIICFGLYDKFITVPDIMEKEERIRLLAECVYKLPRPNQATLERLMTHLGRVASYSSQNMMTAENLATIFAPCVFHRDGSGNVQNDMTEVRKQTTCLKMWIAMKADEVSKMKESIELDTPISGVPKDGEEEGEEGQEENEEKEEENDVDQPEPQE